MATLIERKIKSGIRYDVKYYYYDGNKRRQKKETFENERDALAFKLKIEREKVVGDFLTPNNMLVNDFLEEYYKYNSVNTWGYNYMVTVRKFINNHIAPYFEGKTLQSVSPRDIDNWIVDLTRKKITVGKTERKLKSTSIRSVFYVLKTAFDLAVRWEYIEKTPVIRDAPKKNKVEYTIWSAPMVAQALEDIEHEQLHLALHLAYMCSLRIGEVLGITLDVVNLDKGQIHINKTMARASLDAIENDTKDEIIKVFPPIKETSKSRLVLATPKTDFSDRIVYLTSELMSEIQKRHATITKYKELYLKSDSSYYDNDLLFCFENGNPVEPKCCGTWFERWQKRSSLNFPRLKFHEIRHSSSTYKLSISGSDIKSVQGDTGHSRAQTLLDTYGHIQSDNRIELKNLIESDFYSKKEEVLDKKTDISDLLSRVKDSPELKKELLSAILA